MAVLKEIFKEEIDRLIKIRKFYMDKILELPRGSIVFKNRGLKKYPYLVYREKNKIKTDYLKLNLDELEKLQLDISKRRKYLKLLREIEKDLKSFGNNIYE
jgi:hypothetical protein